MHVLMCSGASGACHSLTALMFFIDGHGVGNGGLSNETNEAKHCHNQAVVRTANLNETLVQEFGRAEVDNAQSGEASNIGISDAATRCSRRKTLSEDAINGGGRSTELNVTSEDEVASEDASENGVASEDGVPDCCEEVPAGMNSKHNSDLKAASGDSAELPGPADKFEEGEDHEEEYEFNCDGCGAGPIIDNRYNSLEKDNYDLCKTCCDSERRNPSL